MHHSALHSHFDIHGAQYHDTILNHCIDILPYQLVLQIPSVCVCLVHLCVVQYAVYNLSSYLTLMH